MQARLPQSQQRAPPFPGGREHAEGRPHPCSARSALLLAGLLVVVWEVEAPGKFRVRWDLGGVPGTSACRSGSVHASVQASPQSWCIMFLHTRVRESLVPVRERGETNAQRRGRKAHS